MRKHEKKQFCKYGHDVSITGRYDNGECIQCLRDKHPLKCGRQPQQFCKNGHDKNIVGRRPDGSCDLCRTTYEKQYHSNYNPIYYEQNKDKILEQKLKYNKENKEMIIKNKVQYEAEKIKIDPMFKLVKRLRNRIRLAIKNNYKAGSAVRDLGCSIEFLKQYIESKFYGDMTWKNWGTYWELDHVEALWKFDLTDREQFLQACNYTNLQPLTIPDHKKKTAIEAKEWRRLKK